MADGVTLPGTGVVVATDDVSTGDSPAGHYQYLKIDAGDNGDAKHVVDKAVPTVLVPVGGKIIRASVTPTVSTSPAYTAKDAVGGLLTFSNAARLSGGSILVDSVTIVDKSQQQPSLELVLFDQTFSASTDNAIFNPSDADLANVIAVLKLADWADFSTNSIATLRGVGLSAKLAGTDLFGQLLTRSTQTFVATSDIIVILHIAQN